VSGDLSANPPAISLFVSYHVPFIESKALRRCLSRHRALVFCPHLQRCICRNVIRLVSSLQPIFYAAWPWEITGTLQVLVNCCPVFYNWLITLREEKPGINLKPTRLRFARKILVRQLNCFRALRAWVTSLAVLKTVCFKQEPVESAFTAQQFDWPRFLFQALCTSWSRMACSDTTIVTIQLAGFSFAKLNCNVLGTQGSSLALVQIDTTVQAWFGRKWTLFLYSQASNREINCVMAHCSAQWYAKSYLSSSIGFVYPCRISFPLRTGVRNLGCMYP